MGLLTFHATVLDEAAGIAVLELDRVAPMLAAIGAHASWAVVDCNATHANNDPWNSVGGGASWWPGSGAFGEMIAAAGHTITRRYNNNWSAR